MVTIVTQRAPGSDCKLVVRVKVWQRLSRPERAAERQEMGPMRPAKRYPIGRTGMDAPLRTQVTYQQHSHQVDPTRKRALRIGSLLSTARTADYPFQRPDDKGREKCEYWAL